MIYHTGSKFLEPQSEVTVRFSGPFIVTVGLSHYETVWKIYIRRQCANQYRSNRVQLDSGSTVKKLIRIISFQSEHWHLFLKLNKFDELVFFYCADQPNRIRDVDHGDVESDWQINDITDIRRARGGLPQRWFVEHTSKLDNNIVRRRYPYYRLIDANRQGAKKVPKTGSISKFVFSFSEDEPDRNHWVALWRNSLLFFCCSYKK